MTKPEQLSNLAHQIEHYKARAEALERGTRLLVQEHNEELAEYKARAEAAEAEVVDVRQALDSTYQRATDAEAKVARVEALRDRWRSRDSKVYQNLAATLTAALAAAGDQTKEGGA